MLLRHSVNAVCLRSSLGGIAALIAPTAPSAPLNNTATAISDTIVGLDWDAPVSNGGSAITGYKIEIESPVDGGWSTLVADTASTDTEYSATGLTPATEYNFRASAINAIGTSDPGNETDATTLATPSFTANVVSITEGEGRARFTLDADLSLQFESLIMFEGLGGSYTGLNNETDTVMSVISPTVFDATTTTYTDDEGPGGTVTRITAVIDSIEEDDGLVKLNVSVDMTGIVNVGDFVLLHNVTGYPTTMIEVLVVAGSVLTLDTPFIDQQAGYFTLIAA